MRPPSAAKLTKQVEDFNRRVPVGHPVRLRKDDGEVIHTKTRSAAWVLSGHTAVVMVDGVSGCYLLDRIRPDAFPATNT